MTIYVDSKPLPNGRFACLVGGYSEELTLERLKLYVRGGAILKEWR
jgi:hypothetical protein